MEKKILQVLKLIVATRDKTDLNYYNVIHFIKYR